MLRINGELANLRSALLKSHIPKLNATAHTHSVSCRLSDVKKTIAGERSGMTGYSPSGFTPSERMLGTQIRCFNKFEVGYFSHYSPPLDKGEKLRRTLAGQPGVKEDL